MNSVKVCYLQHLIIKANDNKKNGQSSSKYGKKNILYIIGIMHTFRVLLYFLW